MHVLRPGLTNPYARLLPSAKKNAAMTSSDPTQNKILGFARMRQVRVRNDSCSIFTAFSRYRTACFGDYTAANEDTKPYGAGTIK